MSNCDDCLAGRACEVHKLTKKELFKISQGPRKVKNHLAANEKSKGI